MGQMERLANDQDDAEVHGDKGIHLYTVNFYYLKSTFCIYFGIKRQRRKSFKQK